MPKMSSLVVQVKTFWAFEWMAMCNMDAVAKKHDFFTTFQHGFGLYVQNHGWNGYGSSKISQSILRSKIFWDIEIFPMVGIFLF